jgi:hypothetical protein
MQAGIFTYPWDLDAEGHEASLGRIADNGFNAVNLATAYHAGKFLLPHNPRRRVYFPEDGALYFKPDLEKYGRIQPRVSSLVDGERDPLRALEREREKYGLALVAWTVVLHNTWLGERYPECTMHTAFGDPLLHSLTPAHPDVQQYMQGLVTDIASSARISAIQLESPDYMGYTHGFHHEVTPVPLNDLQKRLLGLSFNPVEIDLAGNHGIDAAKLQRQVAVALDATWNEPESSARKVNEVLGNPDFEKYIQFLNDVETGFIKSLSDAVHETRPGTEVRLFASMAAGEDGGVPINIVQLADGLMSGYVPTDDDARNRATELRDLMGSRPVYGMVRAISPDADHPEQAASRVQTWIDSGVNGVDIYNYGFMTLPMIEAVGNVLRGSKS